MSNICEVCEILALIENDTSLLKWQVCDIKHYLCEDCIFKCPIQIKAQATPKPVEEAKQPVQTQSAPEEEKKETKQTSNASSKAPKQKLPDWYVQKKDFDGNFASINIIYGTQLMSFYAQTQTWNSYSKFIEDKAFTVLPYSAIAVVPEKYKIYITGGFSDYDPSGDVVIVTWDPDAWGDFDAKTTNDPESELVTPRYLHSVVVKQSNVYVLGGQTSVLDYTAKCEKLDAGLPDLITARSTTAAVVHNDCVYLIGGFTGPGAVSQTIEMLSADDSAWELLQLQDPFLAGVSPVLNGNTILLLGGSDGRRATNRISKFNLESRQMEEEKSSFTTKNSYAGALVAYDATQGKVFIFGGGAPSGEVITESEMKVEPMERMIQPPEPFTPFFLFNSN